MSGYSQIQSAPSTPAQDKKNFKLVDFELGCLAPDSDLSWCLDQERQGYAADLVDVSLVCDEFAENHDLNRVINIKANEAFKVFGLPSGCQVKLNRIKFKSGAWWTPKAGAEFANYNEGSTAIFTNDGMEVNVNNICEHGTAFEEPPLHVTHPSVDNRFQHVSVCIGN